MLNFVNKKEYEEIYNRWKHLRDISHGLEILLDNQKNKWNLNIKEPNIGKKKHCIQIQSRMLKEIWKQSNISKAK